MTDIRNIPAAVRCKEHGTSLVHGDCHFCAARRDAAVDALVEAASGVVPLLDTRDPSMAAKLRVALEPFGAKP